jgi:hypothetical protein
MSVQVITPNQKALWGIGVDAEKYTIILYNPCFAGVKTTVGGIVAVPPITLNFLTTFHCGNPLLCPKLTHAHISTAIKQIVVFLTRHLPVRNGILYQIAWPEFV